MKTIDNKHQKGFTILEFLIATVVVSVILLLVTTVMIGIQDLYYKGIYESDIQEDTRSVVDQINQDIEYTNTAAGATVTAGPPVPFTLGTKTYDIDTICIGTVQYVYIIGLQVGPNTGTSQIAQALWRDTTPTTLGCGTADPHINSSTPSDGGIGYVPTNGWLTNFNVTNLSDGNYRVTISIATGNKNLLTAVKGSNVKCITQKGDQFCATSSLTSEVGSRVD